MCPRNAWQPIFSDKSIKAVIRGLSFDSSLRLAVAAIDKDVKIYAADGELLATKTFKWMPFQLAFSPVPERQEIAVLGKSLDVRIGRALTGVRIGHT